MAPPSEYSTSHLVSPTGLINSIPRKKAGSNSSQNSRRKSSSSLQSQKTFGAPPASTNNTTSSKSPTLTSSSQKNSQEGKQNRRLDQGDRNRGGGMLAAESFQKTYDNGDEPRVRRRSHDEMGHFGGGDNNYTANKNEPSSDAPAPTSHITTNPFMCASIPALTAFTGSGNNPMGSVCVQKYAPLASKAAGQARQGVTEFAIAASEVYRQECRSDNRGGDADFFVDSKETDNNSLMENSLNSSEQRDNKNEVSSQLGGLSRKGSSPDLKRPAVTPSTAASSSGRLTPPPRVDRVLDTRTFLPSKYAPYGVDDDDADRGVPMEVSTGEDDLRSARMELFRNQVSGIDEPEARLARALEDLNRQDVFIQSLKRQMEMTQTTLDETTKELNEVKAAGKDKRFKATEIRARAVQEKKRLEDLYQKEVQENKKLQETVSQLKYEISTLKVSLRNSRSKNGNSNNANKNGSAGHKDDVVSSASPHNAQLISLKAEIVELRSQLAEAHAASIDDCSTLNTVGEIEELRKKLRTVEEELKELRQKNREILQERDVLTKSELDLKKKLEVVETSTKETQSRLEENLVIAIKSADDVRSELVKTKANLQRLERERSRARLNSSADVERMNKDLTKVREECAQLKKELEKVKSSAETDKKERKKEVDDLREKLHNTNQETLTKSSERLREQRKLHDEVTTHFTEIKELKDKLTERDDNIRSKSKQIAYLEEKLLAAKGNVEADSATVLNLEQVLEKSRAQEEALLRELKLYKSLLDEARSDPASPETQLFLANLNNDCIDLLRQLLKNAQSSTSNESYENALSMELMEFKSRLMKSSPVQLGNVHPKTEEQLLAMEQSFLDEISLLKAKLAESQSRIREERNRAHEERRINREGEAERQAELDRLRQENQQNLEAKLSLQAEVADLQKKPSTAASKDDVVAQPPENNDDMGVPNNVRRLRNELARARERLAAARESTRASPVPTTNHIVNGDRSLSRQVDPGIDQPETNASDRTVNSSQSVGSTWAPPSNVAMNCASPASSGRVSNTVLFKAAHSPARSSRNSKKKASLEELTRQLEASRKRLQTADQRLNGLVNEGSLLTIVRKNPNDSSFDGSIDEVVDTADGSIEVNHRRFADV